MIRIENLRVDYESTCAVRDLSLDVEAGTVCGLLGPNGAGKTTTMRTVLGLLEPTYGAIDVAGIDALERPTEARRKLGFMPDFPPIYADLKAWQFLDLFAHSYGISRGDRQRVVNYHLDQVGLAARRDEKAGSLSRGMRQRLMLAKTLIPDPEVLLLDEPASGLDPMSRIALRDIIKQRAAMGRTILVSSHILAEMTEFCDSVAIMDRGQLIISGTIDDVAQRINARSPILIETVGGSEELERVVAEDPDAERLEPEESAGSNRWSLVHHGSREAEARLLATLIRADVSVVAFYRKAQDLESIFLKVGSEERDI